MKTTYLDNEILLLEGYKKEGTASSYQLRKLVEYREIKQLIIGGVGSSLPNVYEEPHNSARIKFYKNLAKTMNVSEYATRHIFNEACDWYKTLA